MEKVGVLFGHLEHISTIWYILWSFGTSVAIWHTSSRFWYILSRQIWQPRPEPAAEILLQNLFEI
jgi:hypothetical protein